jgi:hypothetical protein
MIDAISNLVEAARQRFLFAGYTSLTERELERAIFFDGGSPRRAIEAARDVLLFTNAMRDRAIAERDASALHLQRLENDRAALRNEIPDADTIERAKHLQQRIELAAEQQRALANAIASTSWLEPEAVRRGAVAFAKVAVRLDRDQTANVLDEKIDELRRAAGAVLKLARDVEFERAQAEALIGQRLTDLEWAVDDVELLDRVARLQIVRTQRREPPAAPVEAAPMEAPAPPTGF